MIGVIAALPGIPEALVGGVASFLAPCTLPLVPAWAAVALAANKRMLSAVVAFCAAVVAHLVILGVGSDGLYRLLHRDQGLEGLVGAVIILSAALALLALKKPWLPVAVGLVAGTVFGAAWTPCVGTTLGRLLTPGESALARGFLLIVYGIGLAVPFVFLTLAALAFGPVSRWLSARARDLARFGAVLLGVLALALAAGWYRSIASHLARYVVAGS